MKFSAIYCVIFIGVVGTVQSQVAEKSDTPSFERLIVKELGRLAKNVRTQLHSEMKELVEELQQRFLQIDLDYEDISKNANVEIHENMIQEKNRLEDRYLKVVDYTNHHMEKLTNYLHCLQRAVNGDGKSCDLPSLLVSEAPEHQWENEKADTSKSYPKDQPFLFYTEESTSYSDNVVTDAIPQTNTEEPSYYLNNWDYDYYTDTMESSSYLEEEFSNTPNPINLAEAMRPDDLTMNTEVIRPQSCYELYQNGSIRNGINIIYPEGPGGMGVAVWCEQAPDEGGWTVILGRLPDVKHVEFSRPIHDYIIGFGQPNGHHWIGLRQLESLCKNSAQELKVSMQDWEGSWAFAYYDNFSIYQTNGSWALQVSGYHNGSQAGDSLTSQNDVLFISTPELGGWWHSDEEGGATPTGKYYTQEELKGREAGVKWPTWKGHNNSLKSLLIMIRPKY